MNLLVEADWFPRLDWSTLSKPTRATPP